MQSHQRYFPVRSGGRLEPRFLFVANGGDPDDGVRGNEEVLVGRLTTPSSRSPPTSAHGLAAMAAELDRVSFLEGCGSLADKTARLVPLDAAAVRADCTSAPTSAAAASARPSSQGRPRVAASSGSSRRSRATPGSVYAAEAGEPDERLRRDRGAPPARRGGRRAAGERRGRRVALADKADTLAVAFGLGLEPTGSRDPYGLRRAAAGLVAIALDRRLEGRSAELVGDGRCRSCSTGSSRR